MWLAPWGCLAASWRDLAGYVPPFATGSRVSLRAQMITNYASAGAGQVGETKPILSVLGTGTFILMGLPGAYTPT